MEQTFDPVHGAMVGKSVIYPYYLLRHLASVEMFDEIGMDSLIEKKCYNLLFRIYFARNRQRGRKYFEIITPSNQEERARNYLYCCMVKDEV
jgi:kynureninase